MPDDKYLIIGGGMTAASAVKGMRRLDKSESTGIISNEIHSPYNRPPLSKGLWKGEGKEKPWRVTPTKNVKIQKKGAFTENVKGRLSAKK